MVTIIPCKYKDLIEQGDIPAGRLADFKQRFVCELDRNPELDNLVKTIEDMILGGDKEAVQNKIETSTIPDKIKSELFSIIS
jgi:hypothetical protein